MKQRISFDFESDHLFPKYQSRKVKDSQFTCIEIAIWKFAVKNCYYNCIQTSVYQVISHYKHIKWQLIEQIMNSNDQLETFKELRCYSNIPLTQNDIVFFFHFLNGTCSQSICLLISALIIPVFFPLIIPVIQSKLFLDRQRLRSFQWNTRLQVEGTLLTFDWRSSIYHNDLTFRVRVACNLGICRVPWQSVPWIEIWSLFPLSCSPSGSPIKACNSRYWS